ncbi:hypothetical protein MMC12_005577 [Toensbergia leucococca]|nr:hypothetical protein [Toensbergia leucococca]
MTNIAPQNYIHSPMVELQKIPLVMDAIREQRFYTHQRLEPSDIDLARQNQDRTSTSDLLQADQTADQVADMERTSRLEIKKEKKGGTNAELLPNTAESGPDQKALELKLSNPDLARYLFQRKLFGSSPAPPHSKKQVSESQSATKQLMILYALPTTRRSSRRKRLECKEDDADATTTKRQKVI